MIQIILNLINTVLGLFKGKNDTQIARINQISVQSGNSLSILWLSLLEFILVIVLIWNGVIAPNTGLPMIQTTFDSTTLLFQLLGVTGIKTGIKHIAKRNS